MSKYKVIATEFRNLASLRAALDEMGIQYKIAENPTVPSLPMVGYQGDTRPERASILISRHWVNQHWSGCASNDIGFAWNGHAYGLLISDYDSGIAKTNQAINQLKQNYQRRELIQQATRRGMAVIANEVNPDGSIRLVLRKRM